jgi:CRISPR/Cas system-associated exonuclease Cas4 (RecB family)
MSEYYSAKRTRNLFDPESDAPFRLSRSKIDLFLECPRCFYFDRRLGVGRPPGFPFNLNSAVDHLLKKEFDIHRKGMTSHPIMDAYGLPAIPFQHSDIDTWRENFVGVQYVHGPSNFLVTGAVDDVWVATDNAPKLGLKKGDLIVVDYKSTSKDTEVNLDAEWQDGYKRQMEVYQWLLRQKGFTVSNTGFFVYANGIRDKKAFDGKLEFKVSLIPYTGSDAWIEKTLADIRTCLSDGRIPKQSTHCDYCNYVSALFETLKETKNTKKKANDQPGSLFT